MGRWTTQLGTLKHTMAEKNNAGERTYTVGGTSTVQTDQGPVSTLRVSNDTVEKRTKLLEYYKHTKIKLTDLPKPMTREDAYSWLLSQGYKGVVPTRAKDKRAKNEMTLAAEAKAARKIKAAETREARKKERVAA